MKHVFQVCLLMSFLTGCGSSWEGPKVQVKMEEVPPAALKTRSRKTSRHGVHRSFSEKRWHL